MDASFLPESFLDEMKKLLGDSYRDYLDSFQKQPRLGLRANGLKLSGEELKSLLPWDLSPVAWAPLGYYYPGDVRPALHPAYSAGLFYLQEPSAMAPGAVLPVAPGLRVLDLCAAPGGKSTQLAARLKGRGVLVSNDISPSRAKGLLKNLELAGAFNICVTAEAPGKLASLWEGWFDRILVDAPCSGEGMFRREPDMVKDWQAKGPSYYASIQREILFEAAKMLRPGGQLLYSTCTFSPEEDEGTVMDLLSRVPEMKLLPLKEEAVPGSRESQILPGVLRLFPHLLEGEGHFLALLRKDGEQGDYAGKADRPEAAGPANRAFCTDTSLPGDTTLPGVPCQVPQVLGFLSALPMFEHTGNRLRLIEGEKKRAKVNRTDHRRSCGRNGRGNSRLEKTAAWGGSLKATAADSQECVSGEIYLLPEQMPDWNSLRFLRTGLHVGSLKEGRFEPSQALAMVLNPGLCQGGSLESIDLDMEDERVLRYLKGETISLKEGEPDFKGWVLVRAAGFPLGWARGNGRSLKNKYYPGWRRQ